MGGLPGRQEIAMGRTFWVVGCCCTVVLLLGVLPAEATCNEAPEGLAAWWGGDGNAGDVFGTWNGTLVADTAYGAGMVGQAFSFDGSGDRVDLPDGIGDFGADPFTVEFWLYPTTSRSHAFLIGKSHADGGLGWDMRIEGQRITSEIQAIHAAGSDGSCRPCGALPSAAVGWWRAENSPDDEVGGFDGTLGGGTSYVAGKVGQAFSFNGSSDFVELPDSNRWDFGVASFSINAWFKSGTAGYRNIVRYHDGGGGTGSWGVRFDPNGRLQIVVINQTGSPVVTVTSDAVFADDTWHSVAAVRDAAAGELQLYVDGAVAAAPVSDGGVVIIGDADCRALIGAGGWGGGGIFEPFDGEVDELMIFDRALSLDEVQALANADSTGVCTGCTELPGGVVAWWQAEDNGDDGAGANHGSEVNGAAYATGVVGLAFSLDGLDDYIEVPDSPSLDLTDSITVETWILRTVSWMLRNPTQG